MALLLLAIVFGGPLVVALASALLVVPAGLVSLETGYGVTVVVLSLGVVAASAAAGTAALYRWWFDRAATRGAGLLTALLLLVFFLSHEATVNYIGRVASGEPLMARGVEAFLAFLVEGLVLCGVAVAVCTLLVLAIELPLRWIQAQEVVVSEGAFRMLRLVGVVVIAVISSALLRDEGLLRLESTIRRVLS
jgi:hypothetical protein